MFDQLWSAPKWHTFNILVFRLMILRHSFDLKKRGWIALSTALETRYQFTEYIFVLHCEFTWTKLFLCFSLLTLSQSSINVRHNFSFVMINGKLFHIQIYHKVEKHLFSTYLIARDYHKIFFCNIRHTLEERSMISTCSTVKQRSLVASNHILIYSYQQYQEGYQEKRTKLTLQ